MRVSVVGSINMDMTVTADRIPQKGETIIGRAVHYIPGGKGANQAVSMARLGAWATMFGCVGQDRTGEMLLENLSSEGICTEFIHKIPDAATGVALITVGDYDNTIVVVAGANEMVDVSYIESIKQELLKSDIVLMQQEIPEETVEYVVKLCYDHKIKTVLNPAPARDISKEVIDKVTYLTPNEHEAAIMFGKEVSIEAFLKKYPEKLIITQGGKGVSVCTNQGDILLVPARKAEVVDTTGAGDTLNGAFTVKMAEGAQIREALYFANIAASLSTEKFGAQGGMPDRESVCRELNERNEEYK